MDIDPHNPIDLMEAKNPELWKMYHLLVWSINKLKYGTDKRITAIALGYVLDLPEVHNNIDMEVYAKTMGIDRKTMYNTTRTLKKDIRRYFAEKNYEVFPYERTNKREENMVEKEKE